MSSRTRSAHQNRIEDFMQRGGQEVPATPAIPSEKVRLLRAKLIFEECLETIKALGIEVYHDNPLSARCITNHGNFDYQVSSNECDIVEVADGCADISVVTVGTLSAFGISDMDLFEAIDNSNLAKFAPGWYIADGTEAKPGPIGKIMKPKDWKKPDIFQLLVDQGYEGKNQPIGKLTNAPVNSEDRRSTSVPSRG